MGVKSVIDIEVNDTQFKAFKDIFDQFQSKINGMPGDWKKSDDATKKNAKTFGELADEAQKIVDRTVRLTTELKKAATAQNQFGTSTRNAGSGLKKMAGDAKELGKSIFGIGKFLGKMSLWGLGTASAGMFGLDMLGRSAVSTQRQSRGLGVNQGSLRAFGVDLGRYAPEGMLGNIASAQGDMTKWPYLGLAAGVSMRQVSTMSADDLAIKTLLRAQEWAKKVPASNLNAQFMKSQGFSDVGLSVEDMRRLKASSGAELLTAVTQFQKDRKTLGVRDQTTAEWYNLTRQLALAGQSIETNLINKLSKVGESSGDLITALANDFNALVNSITPADIQGFADGIKSAARYLESDDFMNKLQKLAGAVDVAADGILTVAGWFGKKPEKITDRSQEKITDRSQETFKYSPGTMLDGSKAPPLPSFEENAMRKGRLSELDRKYGLPAGTGWGVYSTESNRGLDPASYKENAKGALGPFQFLKGTGLQYGVLDRSDFGQSSGGYAKYMGSLFSKYGDIKKAEAAYNWGPGNLDNAIKLHGKDWMQFAPKETQGYIEKVGKYQSDMKTVIKVIAPEPKKEETRYDRSRDPLAGYFPKQQMGTQQGGVNVVITNKTGADMAISTNALAH